jgi:hypothetical protein
MRKHTIVFCAASFLLLAGSAVAQNAPDLSGTSSIRAENIQSNQITTVIEPVLVKVDETTEGKVPSALQFLIPFCEEKDGNYYLPKSKFLELTEQQQNGVNMNGSKFIINNEK